MPSKKPQFVIRADQEVFDKIGYIAKENERSTTQEIIYLIKQRIKQYESTYGEIELPDKPEKKEGNTGMKALKIVTGVAAGEAVGDFIVDKMNKNKEQ